MSTSIFWRREILAVLLLLAGALWAGDITWVDVRSSEEYKEEHVPGALNIPYEEIAEGITALQLSKSAQIYLYCGSGRRAGIAKETLDQLGYTRVVNLGSLEAALEKAEGGKPD